MTQVHFTLKGSVAGRVLITRPRADGSNEVVVPWFDNKILDAGLERLGSGSVVYYCQVGAGSVAPADVDVALGAFIASTSTVQSSSSGTSGAEPWYSYYRWTFRLAPGVGTGNISELGFGWAANGSLFSRTLVKDEGGNPITITKLAEETLDVTYELRLYPPAGGDVAFQTTISGQQYDCVSRVANANKYNYNGSGWNPQMLAVYGIGTPVYYWSAAAYETQALGVITGEPAGTPLWTGDQSQAQAYVAGSKRRDFVSMWGLNFGNHATGIGAIRFTSSGCDFQISFNPKIQKTAAKELSLNWSFSWGRHAA